jgi:hypothetical protein
VNLGGSPSLQARNNPMVMIPLADLIEVSSLLKDLDIRKRLTRDLGFPRHNLLRDPGATATGPC